MLEHYEIAELEKKWQEYDKNRKKFNINSELFRFSKIKMDTTILILLGLIVLSIFSIFWILKGNDKKTDEILLTQNEQNKKTINIQSVTNVTKVPVAKEPSYDKSDYNITESLDNRVSNSQMPSLSMNEIGIDSSVDAGGFTIKNNYPKQNQQNYQQAQNTDDSVKSALFNSIPKDDVIDFGNAPIPPRNTSNNAAKASPKIVIQKTRAKARNLTPEEEFQETKDINLAIRLANEKYSQGDYSAARNWALEVNNLDEKNPDGWLIFARSSQKLGRKNDAITALSAFLRVEPNNSEASNLLNELKGGR